MPDFAVVLTERAVADLEALPLKVRLQISQDVASLARDPLPPRPGTKKLKGYRPSLFRLRAGDYRVLYRIVQKTVTVLRVIDRRDLHRTLQAF
ncbi:MAG: type II toxin-antitoxin system RelE/ParE family toxin [Candidatus Tectomicrobia bacterium]|nr:type II toxin-antitoxin system RelE/ParE family toxin [Candidatus Tectomicrobia bacterium]